MIAKAMKLPEYVETIAVGLKDGCLLAQGKGVNITPHLHMDLRGGKCPELPYGNSYHLLLPVELEISLTSEGCERRREERTKAAV